MGEKLDRASLINMYRKIKGLYVNVKAMIREMPCDRCGLKHDIEDFCTKSLDKQSII